MPAAKKRLPDGIDPVVDAAAARRDLLRAELARMDAMLGEYVLHVKHREVRPSVSALDHSTMMDDSDCGCVVCADWTARREEFVEARTMMPKAHKWSLCACPT